jgi:hypothetical protein
MIGTIAGGFTQFSPYTSLHIVAVKIKSGASSGMLVIFLTSRSFWACGASAHDVWKSRIEIQHFKRCEYVSSPSEAGFIAGIIEKIFKPKDKINEYSNVLKGIE